MLICRLKISKSRCLGHGPGPIYLCPVSRGGPTYYGVHVLEVLYVASNLIMPIRETGTAIIVEVKESKMFFSLLVASFPFGCYACLLVCLSTRWLPLTDINCGSGPLISKLLDWTYS
ncbi:hypothetical protein Dimus_022238 [Dionaea muscipula]